MVTVQELAVPTGEEAPYRGESAAPPPGRLEQIFGFCTDDGIDAIVGEIAKSAKYGLSDNVLGYVQLGVQSLVKTAELPLAKWKRSEVRYGYSLLKQLLCTSPLGVQTTWPEGFWDTLLGKLMYAAMYEAYGEELLLNRDVARELGVDLSRVGQIQRLGLLEYIENPYVAHRMQRKRRCAPFMIATYRESLSRSG